MEINYFIKGVVVGIAIAAPVGPVGILTVERSLRHGPMAGLCTGMGAAVADTVYGCIAGFGLTLVSGFLLAWQTPILWTGSIFLSILGLVFLLRAPASGARVDTGGYFASYPAAFFSSLILTLTNPMTIMAFTAVFAGLGLGVAGKNYPAAALLVAGVFTGSAIWWITLAFGAGKLKHRLGDTLMTKISRSAGVILIGFGIWSMALLILGATD